MIAWNQSQVPLQTRGYSAISPFFGSRCGISCTPPREYPFCYVCTY
jgi:hypothetical protein